PRHILYFLALGLFWGLSPSLYKVMGEARVPVTHIIVYTGLGVGLALGLVALAMTGRLDLRREVVVYGLICAALMNLPFGLGLLFARHVPPTELAIIMSLAPFCNYLVALLTGRDNPVPRKLLAIAVGFASSAILILSREGTMSGRLSWWMIASFSGPIMYTAYNWYAAANWPKDAGTISVGAVESVASGLIVLPLLLAVAPPWAADIPAMLAYWSVLAATVMWIAERIAFFTLIRDKGAVYTIQAIYLATPAAVIFAAIFFGGASDIWLWLSLSILMVALWLNNSGAAKPRSA
ncbi:MAG TPA: EamA family transporter, partial [Aestuariivirga sp.]|nr:EamA family transporter [Aestuariivirga sp.]